LKAVIVSSVGLDDQLRQQVIKLVSESSGGQQIQLEEKVDASLIGGFVLTVGDKQVDASLLRQIRNMERAFSENPYISEL